MSYIIGNVSFKNPILTASGTFGMGDVFKDFIDFSKIGGITLKTITPLKRKGNPPPRILETPAGLMNSIGLENEGFDSFYSKLKKDNILKDYKTNVIVSLSGNTIEDFSEMVNRLNDIDNISCYELNLSCPNVHEGGNTFCANYENVQKITKNSVKVSNRPILIKLSPQNDIVRNSIIAEENGASAVVISNTFLGIAIKDNKFYFKNKVAGYSGPAVKPLALYNVYRVSSKIKIPIIASGGISSYEDCMEFKIVGASFFEIGTYNFVDPEISVKIAERFEKENK